MPITNYRFLLDGGTLGRCWLNGAGVFHRDVTDDADFRISTATPPPTWLGDTVGYQIFIDRFADSGTDRPAPDWAIAQRGPIRSATSRASGRASGSAATSSASNSTSTISNRSASP